ASTLPPASTAAILIGDARFDHHRLAFAFAALCQPSGHPFGNTLRGKPEARLPFSGANRQRVVKVRGVGEVAHAELVQPLQWTGAPLPAKHHVDQKLLRVHSISLSSLQRAVRYGQRRAWPS